MRYAIYGAGSLGTILGAYVTKNGGEIELVNRNKAHVNALNTNGAKIIGKVEMTVPVKAVLPDEMSGKYDVIFLMTKQLQNKISYLCWIAVIPQTVKMYLNMFYFTAKSF